MDLLLLTADLVEAIHDEVLNPGELAGRAMNKSLEFRLGPRRQSHRLWHDE